MVPRAGFSVVLGLVLVLNLWAQEPRFADLLIGPNTSGAKARGCCALKPGGEISATGITVRQLIEAAYRRHAFDRREVIGGPSWIDDERFDFTARVAGDHAYDRSGFPAAAFATLRAYLEAKISVRADQRERPVYALMSGEGARPGLATSTVDCAAQMRPHSNIRCGCGGGRGEARWPIRAGLSAVGYEAIDLRTHSDATGADARVRHGADRSVGDRTSRAANRRGAMMLLSLRAVTYATLFIGFVLVALPARLATASGLTSPGTIGWQQILGVLFTVLGGVITLSCVATFVAIGRGTPAPFDPPRRLVDRGPYAVVRNPMYVGAALATSGAGVFFASWVLFAYVAAFLGAACVGPHLRRADAAQHIRSRLCRLLPSCRPLAADLTACLLRFVACRRTARGERRRLAWRRGRWWRRRRGRHEVHQRWRLW